jgi:type II secretory pathway pseudopilin PulG
MKSRSGLTLVEATIVLAMILLLAAISLPAFFKNQDQKREAACVRNLDAIATACRRFAAERGGFPKSLAHLVPDYLPAAPACPAGGTYTLGTPEGDPPTCSIPGHRL